MAKELYVGHLPYEATNDDLRRLFSVAGTVTSVHIITDPVSGKSKGCGYVRMSSEAELQEAINCLDGALMGDMVISVSIARPQKPQQPGSKPRSQRRSGPAAAGGSQRSAEAAPARKPAPKAGKKTPTAPVSRPTKGHRPPRPGKG